MSGSIVSFDAVHIHSYNQQTKMRNFTVGLGGKKVLKQEKLLIPADVLVGI